MRYNLLMLKRAFTLIEIVVVLAIASLIMLVVFLAVTGSQRSQRDQFRKDTANRVLSAAQAYRGNNSGGIVTNAAALASYVDAVDNGTDIVITANGVTVKLDASASPAPPACTSADTPSAATVVFVPSSGSTGDAAFVCLESATGAYKAGN
jgi:prepilin-type N-terminal cleavage/methylation domain-containing protein